MSLSRAGDTAAVQSLVQVDHFDQLILDVGSLLSSIVFSSQSSSTDQDVANTYFASAVGLSVVSGESLYHHSGKVIFTCHEYIFVRDEYVVEYYQSFLSAVSLVTQVNVSSFFQLSCIA